MTRYEQLYFENNMNQYFVTTNAFPYQAYYQIPYNTLFNYRNYSCEASFAILYLMSLFKIVEFGFFVMACTKIWDHLYVNYINNSNKQYDESNEDESENRSEDESNEDESENRSEDESNEDESNEDKSNEDESNEDKSNKDELEYDQINKENNYQNDEYRLNSLKYENETRPHTRRAIYNRYTNRPMPYVSRYNEEYNSDRLIRGGYSRYGRMYRRKNEQTNINSSQTLLDTSGIDQIPTQTVQNFFKFNIENEVCSNECN
jgi:hypothetical protein